VRSGPSVTARAVALGRSRLIRPRTPTGDPEAESRLYAGLGGPLWWPVAARWQRRVAARTRFFDKVTLSAIEAGVTQVVVVGAGYDGRALRFAAPGVRFFEIDHPATQPDKQRRIEALGIRSNAVTYVPHDLTHGELPNELAAAGHDGGRATLFICEGLLLYLTPPVVQEILHDLQVCAGPGSRLALSAGERLAGAPATAKARVDFQRLLLAIIGESRQSEFQPSELDEALRSAGWGTVRELVRARAGRKGMLILAEPRATPTVASSSTEWATRRTRPTCVPRGTTSSPHG
jgi:methyltransferase (TIGR00027 family)